MSVHNDSRHRTVTWWATLGASTLTILTLAPNQVLPPIEPGSYETTLVAYLSLACLALAAWTVTTLVGYTIAVARNIGWAERILRPITLPIIKRIAAGATSAALTFTPIAATAESNPQVQVQVDALMETGLSSDATPTPILEPLPQQPAPQRETLEIVESEPAGSYAAPLVWNVQPGDHLWNIAERHLTIVLQRPPTTVEHDSYWRTLVESARQHIRSCDPDLIYPGEHIPLPALLDANIMP